MSEEHKENGVFYTFALMQSKDYMLHITLHARETTNVYNEPILKYLHSSNFEIRMVELTSDCKCWNPQLQFTLLLESLSFSGTTYRSLY